MSGHDVQSTINEVSSNDLIIILDSILNKKQGLIEHHIESINKFMDSGIKQIMINNFKIQVELNNERDNTEEDKSIAKFKMVANITDVKITHPGTVNYDTQRQEILFPGDAHRKDLTYSSPLYIDAEIICTAIKHDGTILEKKDYLKDHRLGSIPIMVGSKLCNTYNKSRDTLIELNEDPTDMGGYFIVRSNEWLIDNIESMTYNLPREFKNTGFKNENAWSDIISKPGDNFENSSSLVCKYLTNGNIIFKITNNKFRDISIPFYVLFRAFGVCSDKDIIEHITYSLDEGDPTIKEMLTILEKAFKSNYTPIEDAYKIHNQVEILELIGKYINNFYLSNLTTANKNSTNTRKFTINNVLQILDKDILPHVGLTEHDRYKKIRFLGHIIRRLLFVFLDIVPSTDRDSYKNKRINPAGVSYAKVFKTNFNFAIVQPVRRQFLKDLKSTSFSNLNIKHSFETAIYGHEFERALIQAIVTGDKTISINRKSVQNRLSSQQLHRKNQINVISALRNINTTNTSSAKQSARANEMRRFHSSMIGYVCCIQSADTGEKVGMQKQMAISAKIALGSSSEILKDIVNSDENLIKLDHKLSNLEIYTQNLTKVFVNGDWLGCCRNYKLFCKKYRNMRRLNKIHYLTTVSFDVTTNEIYLWTDIGRITRPLIIVYNNEEEFNQSRREETKESESKMKFSQYIKLTKKHILNLNAGIINYEQLLDDQVIEFISPEEQQNCLIAKDIETLNLHINDPLVRYTHLDISQSIIGIPGSTSPYSNHNQAARGVFQTNQVKQTCGIPCLNWPHKTYKEMHLQVYNQKPLVKTIANKYYAPIGMNAIVAIMIYGGYNQEDSLIINQGAVDRGLFTTHHFTFEKTELEKNEEFKNPDSSITADMKAYSNYSKLVNGCVQVGTYIENGDVIIGKICKLSKSDEYDNFKYYDKSIVYKYDEPSYVWNVIKGRNEDASHFCKIVFRSVRKVAIGDKFCRKETSEVLTDSGWKMFKDLTMKDKICSLVNGENIEYVKPIGIYHFEHDGEMIDIQTQQLCSTSTLNHKLYVQKRDHPNYELVEAKDVYKKRVRFKKDGIKLGDDIDTINLGMSIFNMNAYLKLLAMFIADGWIDKRYVHGSVIALSFGKQRKINILKETCEELGVEYSTLSYKRKEKFENSEVDNCDVKHFIKNIDLAQSLRELNVGALNKFIPEFVWELNQKQSRLFLDTLVSFDGTIGKTYTAYYTSSKRLADDVSRLALHAGYSGNILTEAVKGKVCKIANREFNINSDRYSVRIIKSKNNPQINHGHTKAQNGQKIGITHYKGIVSCVEVPSHVFYVRENNIPFWDGNSSRSG